ncbi:hypothetical protein DFJ77DRAFT_444161 [Powellomyces hirtus]|nr:hypothetical protein DFJ77DRAFT_444161 [Powellomyces hirtus]
MRLAALTTFALATGSVTAALNPVSASHSLAQRQASPTVSLDTESAACLAFKQKCETFSKRHAASNQRVCSVDEVVMGCTQKGFNLTHDVGVCWTCYSPFRPIFVPDVPNLLMPPFWDVSSVPPRTIWQQTCAEACAPREAVKADIDITTKTAVCACADGRAPEFQLPTVPFVNGGAPTLPVTNATLPIVPTTPAASPTTSPVATGATGSAAPAPSDATNSAPLSTSVTSGRALVVAVAALSAVPFNFGGKVFTAGTQNFIKGPQQTHTFG